MKKYEILYNDCIVVFSERVYRIRALRDFGNVKAGDLGGYVESEGNLSHDGNCWIDGVSVAMGTCTEIKDNACLYGRVIVHGGSIVSGNARIFGCCIVFSSEISGETTIEGNVIMNSTIANGDSCIYDNVIVEEAVITDCYICDEVKINGRTIKNKSVYKKAFNNMYIKGRVEVDYKFKSKILMLFNLYVLKTIRRTVREKEKCC